MTSVLQTSKECSALAVGCLCAEGVSGFGKGADLSSCLEAIRSPEVKEDKKESLRKGRWRRRCMSPGTGFRVLFVEFQLGWVSMAERKRGKRISRPLSLSKIPVNLSVSFCAAFSSSLSKIQSLSKISYFSFKPVSLFRTPSPLLSLFHVLDENDSLPSFSVTSMSVVSGYYKLTELSVLFISFWVPQMLRLVAERLRKKD
ncbi:hypothetical protein ACFX10_023997 [Malus domestica]